MPPKKQLTLILSVPEDLAEAMQEELRGFVTEMWGSQAEIKLLSILDIEKE